jgi:hypothetical protein
MYRWVSWSQNSYIGLSIWRNSSVDLEWRMSVFSQFIEALMPYCMPRMLCCRSLSHSIGICYYSVRLYLTVAIDVAVLAQGTHYMLYSRDTPLDRSWILVTAWWVYNARARCMGAEPFFWETDDHLAPEEILSLKGSQNLASALWKEPDECIPTLKQYVSLAWFC